MSVGLAKHREAPCKHIIAHCLSKEDSMDVQPTCRSVCELRKGYFHALGPEPSRETEACSYGEPVCSFGNSNLCPSFLVASKTKSSRPRSCLRWTVYPENTLT